MHSEAWPAKQGGRGGGHGPPLFSLAIAYNLYVSYNVVTDHSRTFHAPHFKIRIAGPVKLILNDWSAVM